MSQMKAGLDTGARRRAIEVADVQLEERLRIYISEGIAHFREDGTSPGPMSAHRAWA